VPPIASGVLELPEQVRMAESACNSPARSIGDPNSLTDSELTDLESDSQLEVLTEVPGTPDQTIIDGWVKFRDSKRVRDTSFHGLVLANGRDQDSNWRSSILVAPGDTARGLISRRCIGRRPYLPSVPMLVRIRVDLLSSLPGVPQFYLHVTCTSIPEITRLSVVSERIRVHSSESFTILQQLTLSKLIQFHT
jgi:hypothetical protein